MSQVLVVVKKIIFVNSETALRKYDGLPFSLLDKLCGNNRIAKRKEFVIMVVRNQSKKSFRQLLRTRPLDTLLKRCLFLLVA